MQHLAYLSEMLLWFIQLSSNIISEYFASCFCKLEIGQYSYYWAKLLADLTIITHSNPPNPHAWWFVRICTVIDTLPMITKPYLRSNTSSSVISL